jgi:hypothetical protein
VQQHTNTACRQHIGSHNGSGSCKSACKPDGGSLTDRTTHMSQQHSRKLTHQCESASSYSCDRASPKLPEVNNISSFNSMQDSCSR